MLKSAGFEHTGCGKCRCTVASMQNSFFFYCSLLIVVLFSTHTPCTHLLTAVVDLACKSSVLRPLDALVDKQSWRCEGVYIVLRDFYFILKDFHLFFREGKGSGKERERNID